MAQNELDELAGKLEKLPSEQTVQISAERLADIVAMARRPVSLFNGDRPDPVPITGPNGAIVELYSPGRVAEFLMEALRVHEGSEASALAELAAGGWRLVRVLVDDEPIPADDERGQGLANQMLGVIREHVDLEVVEGRTPEQALAAFVRQAAMLMARDLGMVSKLRRAAKDAGHDVPVEDPVPELMALVLRGVAVKDQRESDAEKLSDLDERGSEPYVAGSSTSRRAAALAYDKVSAGRRKLLRALVDGPLTRDQIAAAAGMSPNTVRPRVAELLHGGWLEVVDKDGVTAAGGKAERLGITSTAREQLAAHDVI